MAVIAISLVFMIAPARLFHRAATYLICLRAQMVPGEHGLLLVEARGKLIEWRVQKWSRRRRERQAEARKLGSGAAELNRRHLTLRGC